MVELTLQFVAIVEGPSSSIDLLETLTTAFPDSKALKHHSFDLRNNWIEIWKNKDADPHKTDFADGYLFYEYEVQVTPMATVKEDHQIQLAREIVAVIEEKGWKVVVCANFEKEV